MENLNSELEAIENVNAYIGTIDENGSIEIEISEENGDIVQGFIIRASRKLTMFHIISTLMKMWIFCKYQTLLKN